MDINIYCFTIPVVVLPTTGCLLLFTILWLLFWWSHRGLGSFYFDPQDFVHYEKGVGRELPVSAATATFEPHIEYYTGSVKLMITVGAASIAFGGNQSPKAGIFVAKIIIAFSILYRKRETHDYGGSCVDCFWR